MAKKKRAGKKSPPPPPPAPEPATGPWPGITLGYFILAVVLASILFPRTFWGIASPHYYPWPAGAAALAVILLSFHPTADRLLERLFSWEAFPRLAAVLGVILVVGAWMNRIQLNWLGDQTLWLRDVDKHDLLHPIEPLSYELVELSHDGFVPWVGKEGERLLSVLLGGAFFYLAWKVSGTLMSGRPTRRAWLWAAMCFVPQWVFYYGYVESYPYLLLCLLGVAWAVLRLLRGASPVPAGLAVILATAMHMFGLASVAAVATAAWIRKQRLTAGIIIVVASGLMLAWLIRVNARAAYFVNDIRTTFTFFDLTRAGWHRFLGWGHLRSMLNIVLLTAGPALCLAPFVPWRRAWKTDRPRLSVLLLLAAPALGGLLLIRLLLGAPRDWDLFAAYLYFIPVVVLWAWLTFTPGKGLPRFAAAFLTVSLLHAGFWISMNMDRDRGMTQATMLYGEFSHQARKPVAKAAEELGILERQAGNYDSALAWFSVCIQKVPTHWRYYNLYANAAFLKGDRETALNYFWKAVDLTPDTDNPYADLGKVYLLQGDGTGALKAYRRAIHDRGPRAEWYLGLGTAYTFLEDYDGALAVLDSCTVMYPDYTLALLQRGAAKYFSGDFRGAIDDLQRGLEQNPQQTQAMQILVQAAEAVGDSALAESTKNRIRTSRPPDS